MISGDGDLFAIGGNHLIHAARRNMDLIVDLRQQLHLRHDRRPGWADDADRAQEHDLAGGQPESPFNLPYLAAASGATYVARWTTLHVRRLQALDRRGAPQERLPLHRGHLPLPDRLRARATSWAAALDMMKLFHDKSVIQHGADPRDVDIDLDNELIVGHFVDRPRPSLASGWASRRRGKA